MAFNDAQCPCGGRKKPDTMLCDACNAAFANTQEAAVMQDPAYSTNSRRVAAIRLLQMARRRNKGLEER